MTNEYIAGFFDGEGSIIRFKGKVKLQITQASRPVLEMIKFHFGFGSINELKKRKPHWKDAWVFIVTNNRDCLAMLNNIAPYLVVKKQQALQAIDYLNKWCEKKSDWEHRNEKAIEMVKAGMSYRKIQNETKISRQTICNRYKKVREAA